MKQYFKRVLSLILCTLILAVGLPVSAETFNEPIRILAIGNSFSNNATYYISRIAESMGKDVSVVSLYYAGCTLKQHVEFYNSDSRSYQFYEDGVNLTTGQWQTMKEVFELYDYDYVTLQQSPSGSDVFSTYWTEEQPWLTQLYDIVTEHEPQAEVLVHQTWSFCHDCAIGNDPYWSTNYKNSKEMFGVIEDCYEQMADKIGVDKESGIIPVGKAIQLAKDQYGYGDFYNKGSGLTDAQHCANGALYTDNVDHLNMRGRYIAGCVWLEKVFGYDCRTATYFPEGILTQSECEILRAIAHEAVTGEKGYVEGDWRVLPDGDGVEIVHFMGTVPRVGTVAVPAEINGKKVVGVDDTAFKYVEGVEKLILPEGDTIVYEDGAIDGLTVLDNIWDGTSLKPTKGMGSKDIPFIIENGSHLRWAVSNVNKGVYFKLANDIILNDIEVDTENGIAYTANTVNQWFSSGKTSSTYFQGIIDGDYHKIYGLYFDEDFNNTEQVWNIGAALIPRAGNGATIKNLGIENSFVKAVGATAAAFIGTTGSGASNVITIENCYVGEDVYIYGDDAGAFIGAGNGTGYTNGITDCYSLATVGGTLFYGSITGGIWSGQNCPVTNVYTNNSKFHGQGAHKYVNCFAVTQNDLSSNTFISDFAGLGGSFTFAEGQYPVLKSWVGKSDKIWSGFAVNTLKGDGTQSSPYLISDGEGLAYAILNCGTGKYYKLTNDIYLNDINGVNWETAQAKDGYVAASWLEEVTFNGYFDGDGYVVYGIYYPVGNGKESETFRSVALFPLINSNTHVKNVGVRYSHIEVFGHASGIVGFIKRNDSNKNIVIDSCFADNSCYIVHTRQNGSNECSSAGILGGTLFTPNITISNCYSLANLSGPYNIAHIIGSTWQVPETLTAENCYSVGKPWANSSAAVSVKTVKNCYSAVAPGDTYAVWTQVSDADMQGNTALTNMPLGEKFLATDTYPVLKVLKNAVPVPPAEEEEEEEEQETIKILAIGNSYSNNTTYYISRIAESLGKKVTAVSLYDDGCPIKRHVEWYNTSAKEYQFYVDSVNISGSSLQTMQEVFDLADFDYVTIQQGPGPATDFSTYWTEEEPWLTQLYDIIKKHEPQAEVLIHQTWSFSETDCLNGTRWWSTTYDNSLEMYKLIENAYEQAADKLGISKETGIIPTGKAIQLAKDEYGYFDGYNQGYATLYPDGLSTANAAKHCENGALYTDDINHLNHRGRYIAGCVWLEYILGYDCREATFFPEGVLTAEECVILRNIAHEAVTGEKAYIEGDWRVLPDGDGVELLHYFGNVPATGTLAVPTEVNGKKVTRVDDTAYKYVDGLYKLILPDADIVYEDGAVDGFTILDNVWDGTSLKPTEGDGSENNPYKIYNGSHLYWAVTNNNKGVYFEVQNDILLNDMLIDIENKTVAIDQNTHSWYLGGSDASVCFEGIIDGKNHVIKGLYIDNDYNATEKKWDYGAGLIARAGDGAKIKNLAIDDSYIKALNGAASAFIGTIGNTACDLSIENCYIGENVYIFGAEAGGFIGAGNGSGLVSGITDCYNLGTVEADGFVGGIVGGVWSGTNCPVTNCYATKVKLYGQNPMKFANCFAATGTSENGITVLSAADMQGKAAMTKMAALKDTYTLPAKGTPVLKSWAGKGEDIWSGFMGSSLKGEGTKESPYLITNGEELVYAISGGGKGKYYRVENDIYLNSIDGVDWSTGKANGSYAPSAWISNVTFTGYFDGNGHIVYGIYYPGGYGNDLSEAGCAALIPQITKNTHVTNVGVRYSRIDIFGRAAGIVGAIVRDTASVNIIIDSCFTDETVYVTHTRLYEATNVCSSGIVGGTLFTPNVKISNCYSFANLSGPYSKGKIVGSTWEVPTSFVAENCYGDGSLWLCSSSGNALKTAVNCYSTVEPNATYTTWTQLTAQQMQGSAALTNMPLGNAYAVTDTYPVLKVFLPKDSALPGDVNDDGAVNGTDLALLKIYLAGASKSVESGADVNGDSFVNGTDLAILKLMLAGAM